MSNEVIIFVDAVALVIDYLNDNLAVPVLPRIPDPRLASFVTVNRTGGTRSTIVTDAAQLTVDTWADAAEDAHDLAQLCRGLLHALGGTQHNDVTVYRVVEIAGPSDLPDPISNQPRYRQTFQVSTRGAAA